MFLKSRYQLSSLLFAILAGVLVAKGFEPNNWLITIFGIAILARLINKRIRRQRFVLIGLFSISYLAVHIAWVKVLGPDAWLLLTLIAATPWLMLAYPNLNIARFTHQLLFASFVVTIEVVRSHFPWDGFPWGLLAYSQTTGPLLDYAKIGGQSLVTFLVVLLGLQISSFAKPFRSFLIVLAILLGATAIPTIANSETIHVVAIQGNVPRAGLDLESQRKAVFSNHWLTTMNYEANAVEQPDLVVWPESSTDIDPLMDGAVGGQIQNLVATYRVPILVGATINGFNPDGPRNAGILWREDRHDEIYIKNQLVPFGEYLPFRNVLAQLIDRFKLIPNDFVAGTHLGLFTIKDKTFGDVICFEVAYGDYMRRLVNSGADFITVQTNNATYGRTWQPEQQFEITRFRAVEHGRAILVASTSGISGAIDQNGEVLAKTGEFVATDVSVNLPVVETKTVSDTYPRWMTIFCLILTFSYFVKRVIRNKIA